VVTTELLLGAPNAAWRNRIVGHAEVAPAEAKPKAKPAKKRSKK